MYGVFFAIIKYEILIFFRINNLIEVILSSVFDCVTSPPSLKSLGFGVGCSFIFVGRYDIIAILTGLGRFNRANSSLIYYNN